MGDAVTEVLEALVGSDLPMPVAGLAGRLSLPAERLDAALDVLAGAGLADATGGTVTLTEGGRNEAWQVVRRHRVTLLLLTDLVGIPWPQAHSMSTAWENLVDDEIQRCVLDKLGQPSLCPYGHPLSSGIDRQDGVLLADAADGPARVVSLAPRLVADPEALEILAGCGARPGDDIEIKSRRGGWFEIAGSIRDAALPPIIAGNLTVAPHPA